MRSSGGTVATAGGARARAAPTRSRPDPFHARRAAFERYFAKRLASLDAPGALGEAIRYAALSPGKRLRPMLAFAGCEAVGRRWIRALPAAAAVEAVHAFSLVHDDLPAMDDDDFRRGLPTTHKKYGEAQAILAGDALLAFAFEELTSLARRGVRPSGVLEAVTRLARAAGGAELVAGQALDLDAERRDVGEPELRAIHLRKTGALFGAALALGGLAGGASGDRVEALDQAGRHLGLAFQIQDDVLNAGSTLSRLGKRPGTDAARGKATYPGVLGVELAARRAEAHLDLARCILEDYGLLPPGLARLLTLLAARDR